MDRELIELQEIIFKTHHERPFIKKTGKWGIRGTSDFDSKDELTTYRKYFRNLQFKNLL